MLLTVWTLYFVGAFAATVQFCARAKRALPLTPGGNLLLHFAGVAVLKRRLPRGSVVFSTGYGRRTDDRHRRWCSGLGRACHAGRRRIESDRKNFLDVGFHSGHSR